MKSVVRTHITPSKDLFDENNIINLLQPDPVVGIMMSEKSVTDSYLSRLAASYYNSEGEHPKVLYLGPDIKLTNKSIELVRRNNWKVIRLENRDFESFLFFKNLGCRNLCDCAYVCYDCHTIFLEDNLLQNRMGIKRRCRCCHSAKNTEIQ